MDRYAVIMNITSAMYELFNREYFVPDQYNNQISNALSFESLS